MDKVAPEQLVPKLLPLYLLSIMTPILHTHYFTYYQCYTYFLLVVQQSNSGLGSRIHKVSTSHTVRHTNTRQDRRTDLYLTTHNTHNRQTSMPPDGFEPTISAGERPQTHALDRAATGIGIDVTQLHQFDSVVTRHINKNLKSNLNALKLHAMK